jgi:hypothetical protein
MCFQKQSSLLNSISLRKGRIRGVNRSSPHCLGFFEGITGQNQLAAGTLSGSKSVVRFSCGELWGKRMFVNTC